MKRRRILSSVGAGLAVGIAGCPVRPPGSGLETTFEVFDAELGADDPPEVSVDGDTVTARGTIRYGSSSCGTVELAHAAYEDSQDRLDLLVVAADD